jgi:Uncharacterized protein conserved in bacteria
MMPTIASRLRLSLLMFFGVYPVITLYIYALFPFTDGWQMWQRTLLLVPLMVLTMVFFVMPVIQTRFGAFIAGRKTARAA